MVKKSVGAFYAVLYGTGILYLIQHTTYPLIYIDFKKNRAIT
ncbi:glyoxalase [Neisseria macacae ATCC 33926]|uniref:Glyoxalase n=1 Tax=Neisseria macacae ATCC 33926 TaxID=997348 RepID=A0AA36XKW3_9NEIS|nr:glyoxalase [Neisseria macacae ATCC 33926]